MPQKKPEIDGADEEQIRYALEIIGRGDEFDKDSERGYARIVLVEAS